MRTFNVPPSPRVPRTIKSSGNTVRTGVFVGHAVRYLKKNSRTSLTGCLIHSGTKTIRSERRHSLDNAFNGHGGGGGYPLAQAQANDGQTGSRAWRSRCLRNAGGGGGGMPQNVRFASPRLAATTPATKWAKWLPHPCRIGEAHRFRAGGKIRSGPQVGEMATSPLPYRGSPPLQSGGQNQKWPTSGQIGYLTHAVSGSPTASERGAKSEVAHKWAKWLPHPCRIGDPHRFKAGGKIS